MRPDQTCAAVVVVWDGATATTDAPAVLARIAALSAYGVHVGVLGQAAMPLLRTLAPGPGRVWGTVGPGLVVTALPEAEPVAHDGAEAIVPEEDGALEAARQEVLRRLEDLGVGPQLVLLPDSADAALAALDDQLRRVRCGRVPWVARDRRWVVERHDAPERRRVGEALFTLCSGDVGTRGTVEEEVRGSESMVLAGGVYSGTGCDDGLLVGPSWTDVALAVPVAEDVHRLDLRTGVLVRQELGTGVPLLRSARFASITDPGVGALRIEAAADRFAAPGVETDGDDEWCRRDGDAGGGIGTLTRRRSGTDDGLRTVEVLAAVVGDPWASPTRAAAERRLAPAARQGFDVLLSAQREAWARRWASVGVSLPDDPEVELGLRFVLFHLWGLSVGDGGRELAVGARGLSGRGYAGHVFWDADVFVLPALMTIDPEAARAMVRYRLRRLPAARAHAEDHGCGGARFPWESALTGDDVTPRHGDLGGEEVPIFTGLREEHVTADVAWAAVRQATWAGCALSADEQLLVGATADYWASRIPIGSDGRAHLRGVIGPDEYHEDVDDNAFTNGLVRWNLRTAAASVPRAAKERRHGWLALAEALVDGYDDRTGRYEQFAGYFALEPLLIADLGTPPLAADVLVGRRRIERSQVIKQPDVLMLHVMLPDELRPGSLEADLDHYLPRTAHGSSLSPAPSALVLARAGRTDEARALLTTALRIDLDDRAGTTAGGLHLGAMGGAWQAFLFGFLGVDVVAGVLRVAPRVPAHWRDLEVRFRALGTEVRLALRADRVTISSLRPIRARLDGGPVVHVMGGHRPHTLLGGTG